MATKDNSSGLLAKVASLVRSSSGDASHGPDEGETGKQAIRRMIERKAHNDAVRQREFSQLRKLREATPAAMSEMAARASFYQDSSGFSTSEGRQSTLKKIDEIEAQMSKQWWKGQQSKSSVAAPAAKPQPQSQPVSASGSGMSQLDTCNTFAPTIQTDLGESALHTPSKAPSANHLDKSSHKSPGPTSRHVDDVLIDSGFANSMMESIDRGQALSDPVLEDAAIRFANSDDDGAESVLTLALKGQTASQASKDTWIIALLDMYRSTSQQTRYDQLLLDNAHLTDRVQRSLIPAQSTDDRSVGGLPSALPSSSAPAGFAEWHCPEVLDQPAVAQLQASVATGRSHTRLVWQALKSITPEAAQALIPVMEQWCNHPLTLQFDGLEVLDGVLRVNTPVGDRLVESFWWQLRLTMLRVLGSEDEFELVSMDYCITYEVSPPAWQSARCHRAYGLHLDAQAVQPTHDDNQKRMVSSALPADIPLDANTSANRIELVGDILGSGADGLIPLQSALQLDEDLLVDCGSLVRVDFSAAGSILNWVANAQASGKKIEFSRLPHLVAAFFNLIGINEHAQVTARVN